MSGDAFDVVDSGVGYTTAYTASPAISGAISALFTPGATSADTWLEWDSTSVGTIGPIVWTRFYMQWTDTLPLGTTNNRVHRLYSGASVLGSIVTWGTGVPGKFTYLDSTGGAGANSTLAMSAGVTYRFECQWTLSATVGQIVLHCYLGDSTTPSDTIISPATVNFFGTTTNMMRVGFITAGSNAHYGPMAVDGLGISTTNWLGPVAVTPSIAWITA